MGYRSELAQKLHNLIVEYVRDGREEKLKRVGEFLSSNKPKPGEVREYITELSINGHSHLVDILHLPYEMDANDKQLADKITLKLIKLLFAEKSITAHEKVFLLTQNSKDGFTPLHSASKSGNAEVLKAYLKQVLAASQQKLLKDGDLARLLTSSNEAGFTPLHSALISGNAEVLKAYLE